MSTLTHLGKMFGLSVGWFGGWAKSYVQVEYANRENFPSPGFAPDGCGAVRGVRDGFLG